MNHIYTGLDIGNGEIKIVVVNAIDNNYHVLAATGVKTLGLKKNTIYDDKKLKSSLLKALKITEEKIGMKIKEVILFPSLLFIGILLWLKSLVPKIKEFGFFIIELLIFSISLGKC